MPFASLRLISGVDTEKTPSLNEAGISASNFIRWRDGIVEKRGGWAKYSTNLFPTTIRELHAWQDINANLYLGVACTGGLYYINAGAVTNISANSSTVSIAVSVTTIAGSTSVRIFDTGRYATVYDSVIINTPIAVGGIVLSGEYPITASGGADSYYITAATAATSSVTTGGVVPLFTTNISSPSVKVTLANHGYSAGQYFYAPVSTTVGGITISGKYLIASVTDTSNFVITTATSATSSATGYMNGGNASYTYYFVSGPGIIGSGFGIGGFGAGGFGTGVTYTQGTGTNITATDYFLDNWGDTLLSVPVGGPVFGWSPSTGAANSGIIQNAPLVNQGMFVAQPSQQVMCWGSSYGTVSDPLQIRWSDAGNNAVWAPTVSNQAGGYHIPTGARIVRGMQSTQNTLWWTDIDLYIGTYVGAPFIWGFNKVAGGCGLIAPKAVALAGTAVYWMSQKQFFVFAGEGVQTLPCRVWDAVFQNINSAYVNKIRCGTNAQFNEVIWYYPSAASTGENDSYVCYNTVSNEWDIGALGRTAWIDQSILGAPIGSGVDNYVYQHETSPDAAGSAISASFTTGYFTLSEGEDLIFVDWMLPDFKWGTYPGTGAAQVKITFNVVDYIGDTPRVYGPYTMTSATEFIAPRFRGRFVQIVVSSTDLGSFWRLGRIRYRFASDGRR